MRVVAEDAWHWARANDFTGSTLKLQNEAKEFADEPCLEEAADVFISLVVACQKLGWTPADLEEAVERKMAINRRRAWALADDGTFQHVVFDEAKPVANEQWDSIAALKPTEASLVTEGASAPDPPTGVPDPASSVNGLAEPPSVKIWLNL